MVKSNLVIQTAFLGDLILSIPTLNRIKYLFPDDLLIVVCKKGLGDFLIREKIVDQVIEVEKSNSQSYKAALSKVSALHVRNLYCLHRSVRSLLFSFRIKAENKIGFSSLLGFFIFDKTVEYVSAYPEALRQIKIVSPTDPIVDRELGQTDYSYLNTVGADGVLPLVPDFFSFNNKKTTPASASKKIAIFPGSVWATKMWTKSGFIRLVQLLVQSGFEVSLFGSPDEKQLCEEVAPGSQQKVHVLAGELSIAQTIHKLSEYDVVISNDSASTHMAAYNQIASVAIFGPTVPAQGFRPWSNKALIIQNNAMDCRPCGKHGHKECPLGHHNCMKSIAAEEVFSAVKRILAVS